MSTFLVSCEKNSLYYLKIFNVFNSKLEACLTVPILHGSVGQYIIKHGLAAPLAPCQRAVGFWLLVLLAFGVQRLGHGQGPSQGHHHQPVR